MRRGEGRGGLPFSPPKRAFRPQELDNRCEIRTGEANAEIRKWCAKRDWKKERAVVFLDPYGMQVVGLMVGISGVSSRDEGRPLMLGPSTGPSQHFITFYSSVLSGGPVDAVMGRHGG